jgi:hypothetical protein
MTLFGNRSKIRSCFVAQQNIRACVRFQDGKGKCDQVMVITILIIRPRLVVVIFVIALLGRMKSSTYRPITGSAHSIPMRVTC